MKKYMIVLAIGLAAIGIFAFFALNSTKEAPAEPESPPPAIVEAKPEPKPELPSLNQGSGKKMDKQSTYTGPKKIVLDGSTVEIRGQQVDLSQFMVRAEPGDIEGAIRMYKEETDPYEKVNRLNDLAYQPAESPEIQGVLLEALKSNDLELHEAAFETIIIYEDKTIIPELKKLVETSDSDLVRQKAKEAIELLEAPSYSELYFEGKAKK